MILIKLLQRRTIVKYFGKISSVILRQLQWVWGVQRWQETTNEFVKETRQFLGCKS